MSKKLEELKDVMKTLEMTKKEIENKYSQLDGEIKKIDANIDEKDIELKPLDLHITRLKTELTEVNPKDAVLIAEYERQIKEALNSSERQRILEDKDKLVKEKEELLKKVSENRLDNEKNKKIELRQADDNTRKTLTQEKIKIEAEIVQVDANMKQQLAAMQNFKYEYEEKDGVRIATNGMQMKAINDKYAELTDQKRELQGTLKYCEEMLEDFRKKDEEEVAKMSEAWNEAWKRENKVEEKPLVEPLAQEESTPETPVQEEPTPEQPAQEETTPEPPTQEETTPETPVQEESTPEPPAQEESTPEPEIPQPKESLPEKPRVTAWQPPVVPHETSKKMEFKPIKSISINVDSRGTKMDIYREKAFDWASEVDGRTALNKDRKVEVELPEEFKKIYSEANKLGDKFITRELIYGVKDGRLNLEEAQNQLQMYVDLLKGEKEPDDKENKLNLSYNLKRLRKTGLTKEQREDLKENAKRAKDLRIADVKAPLTTKLKWKMQDIANSIKKGLPKGNEPQKLNAAQRKESTEDRMKKFKAEMAEARGTTPQQPTNVEPTMSSQIEESINKAEGIEPGE